MSGGEGRGPARDRVCPRAAPQHSPGGRTLSPGVEKARPRSPCSPGTWGNLPASLGLHFLTIKAKGGRSPAHPPGWLWRLNVGEALANIVYLYYYYY